MPQRRNSNVARHGAADEFTVYLNGVCQLAPTTTWKELKDLARQWLGETIRRTEEEVKRILGRVEVYQSSGIGYIPVKGEEHGREICAGASNCVCNGSTLKATLVEGTSPAYQDSASAYRYYQPTADSTFSSASGQSPPPAVNQHIDNHHGANLHWREAPLLSPHQPEYPGDGGPWILVEGLHAGNTGSSALPWATSHSTLPGLQYLPVTSAVIYSVPSVMPMEPGQLVPGPPHPLQYMGFAPSQLTHTNYDGIPVNVGHGAVPTEARGVFVQNLSYEATSADVENLMKGAGPLVRCQVNTDTGTGRSKGSAIVKFTSAEDVTKALDLFNGTWFMGRPLTVRLDKNQEVNSDAGTSTEASSGRNEQEPIIVDGSTGCT